MDGLSRVLAICSIPLLVITLFLTYKFLTIANHAAKETILNQELPLIASQDEEVKTYPEKDDNSESKSNQMIYDFVNNSEIDYEPEVKKIDLDQYTNLPDKNEYLEQVSEDIPEEERNNSDPILVKEIMPDNISVTTAVKPQVKTQTEGIHMLQIGAFSNKKNATSKLEQLTLKYPNDFGQIFHKIIYVENHQYGSLYKLKVGSFKSEDKARKFCNHLRTNNISCFYAKN